MKRFRIDLYSDTKSLPSLPMKQAMMDAEIGDEQHGEDPTVDRLCRQVADLLGKEAAVFLPSGTMANEIAVLVQCRPGDEILTHRDSHILNFEGGGPAALGGVMVRALDGARGMFDVSAVDGALRKPARHLPRSRLLVIEQTTNLGGGAVWPLDLIRAVTAKARDAGLAVHIDGARLMNACVASGVSAAEIAHTADTVSLDFSKGLGAPFGAVLAGDSATIAEAWRWKQRLGGSMRQAGLMAAGCMYGLDHNLPQLSEDHENARLLAEGLGGIAGVSVRPPETNMVFADLSETGITAAAFNQSLASIGARVSLQGDYIVRAVTHLGIDRRQIDEVIGAAQAIFGAEQSKE